MSWFSDAYPSPSGEEEDLRRTQRTATAATRVRSRAAPTPMEISVTARAVGSESSPHSPRQSDGRRLRVRLSN